MAVATAAVTRVKTDMRIVVGGVMHQVGPGRVGRTKATEQIEVIVTTAAVVPKPVRLEGRVPTAGLAPGGRTMPALVRVGRDEWSRWVVLVAI